jgi:hypothetical protein
MNDSSQGFPPSVAKFPKKKNHYTAVPLRILFHIAWSTSYIKNWPMVIGVIIELDQFLFTVIRYWTSRSCI